jgi:nucleoside-diphosphate-sugar epimerase
MNMKKILITGGAGFIGYHLSLRLLKTYGPDTELVLVDNFQRGAADDDFKKLLEYRGVRFLNLDLTDQSSYKKLGNGYNHVYHLAAINGTKYFYQMPHETSRINLLTLIYILEWFRTENSEGKLCFTSSNEAYAGGLNAFGILPIPTPENVPLVIEDPFNPRWSYAATKLMGEVLMIHYAAMYNLRALIVRPHNFYGPRAGYDHVIPEFSIRILARVDPFPIYGADDTRTFCYIEDAVRAMQMLMDSAKTDNQPIEIVHIGDTKEIMIRDLAEKLFLVAGWKPKTTEIKDSPHGSVKRRLADITKLKNLVGWQSQVSLDEGLKKTFEWYLQHPNKS